MSDSNPETHDIAARSQASNQPEEPRWEEIACALCGAEEKKHLLVDRVRRGRKRYDFNVVRCERCGFVYVNPRGSGSLFDNEAGGAARLDAAVANEPIYVRGLAGLREAGLPAEARILDLGCARGDFMAFAKSRGLKVEGVDLNPALAQQARDRGFEVVTGDLRALDLEPVYDAVTLWDVIEHVDDPVGVLVACRKVLKHNGLVFFHTGNARFQIPKAKVLSLLKPDGGPYLIPFQHLSHFDPDTAASAFARAGLEPVSVDFAGTLHYRDARKRRVMTAVNTLGALLPRVGGPLLTNAMGAIGRRVD